jgi:hypothetical protein
MKSGGAHFPMPLGPTMANRLSRSSPKSRLRKSVGPPGLRERGGPGGSSEAALLQAMRSPSPLRLTLVVEADVVEADDWRVELPVRLRELEYIVGVLLQLLHIRHALQSLDARLNQGGTVGVEPEG